MNMVVLIRFARISDKTLAQRGLGCIPSTWRTDAEIQRLTDVYLILFLCALSLVLLQMAS